MRAPIIATLGPESPTVQRSLHHIGLAMMGRAATLGSVLLAAALPACSANPQSKTAQRAPLSAEALCLQAPDATRAPAPELTRAQQRARSTPALAAAWVATGHAFVQRARRIAAPELYRNVQGCAEAALARSPDDAAALQLETLVLLNDHRFAQARDRMRALLASRPDDAAAWQLRSDAELELGELDQAIESAQRMMDLKPNLQAYGRAAHLRWLQGDVAAARRLYELAIRAGRQHADPEPRAFMICQAALVFWHAGDYVGADAGFDLALAQLPDYPAAQEGKGRVALSRGDYPAAIRWLDKAHARTGLAETAWMLGDAYQLAGQHARAQEVHEQLVQSARRHDPRTLAAFFAAKNRDIPEAIRLARAELTQRADLYTKDVLAYALYRAGQLDEAARLSDEALAAGTQDARLLFHAGTIAAARGDRSRAAALTERALKLNPSFDPLLVAQARAEQHASAR